MQLHNKSFAQLTTSELYGLLKLRQDVFTLEQQCVWRDLDDNDQRAQHIFLCDAASTIVGCVRVFAPNIIYEQASLGRLSTAFAYRKSGLGRRLVAAALEHLHCTPQVAVKIAAQRYLESFYGSFGFVTISDPYLEDNIVHVNMLRPGL